MPAKSAKSTKSTKSTKPAKASSAATAAPSSAKSSGRASTTSPRAKASSRADARAKPSTKAVAPATGSRDAKAPAKAARTNKAAKPAATSKPDRRGAKPAARTASTAKSAKQAATARTTRGAKPAARPAREAKPAARTASTARTAKPAARTAKATTSKAAAPRVAKPVRQVKPAKPKSAAKPTKAAAKPTKAAAKPKSTKPAQAQAAAGDDLLAVVRPLLRVRQIREFNSKRVTRSELDAITEAARWTGSSRNEQPCRFIALRNKATIERIAELGLPQTRGLPTATAAVVIVEPDEPERAHSRAFDDGRAAERILIAANLLGLAGGISRVRADVRAPINELLGLPPNRSVRTIVAIGHPTAEALAYKTAPGTARLPREDVIFEEGWSSRE